MMNNNVRAGGRFPKRDANLQMSQIDAPIAPIAIGGPSVHAARAAGSEAPAAAPAVEPADGDEAADFPSLGVDEVILVLLYAEDARSVCVLGGVAQAWREASLSRLVWDVLDRT